MYPPFLPYARRLLKENDVAITFVDVGSRNGILELANIAESVDAYGFEPNPEEYEKLLSGQTDAAKFHIKSPPYRSIHYFPCALAHEKGRRRFHITHGPGAAGLLEPNISRLEEIRWQARPRKKNLAEDVFAIDKIIDVETKTLEQFAQERSFSHIDYLKIDVEGSEYEVLEGAGNFLSHVGVIKVEVCFIPVRKQQKLFSEVDLLLRKYGFDLLKYEISPSHIGLKERTTSWDFGPSIGIPERYGQPIIGDAIYVNRQVVDEKLALAQAIVLLEKNYLDEALFILRTKTACVPEEFIALLKNYRGQWRIRLLRGLFQLGRRLVKSHHLWK